MAIKSYIKRVLRYLCSGIPEKKVTLEVSSLSPSNLLDGNIALITGGTSGIGREIAIAFLKAGAEVIITGRQQQRIVKVIDEINHMGYKGKIHGIEMDNADVSSFSQKLQEILEIINHRKINILVNNAGINGGGLFNCSEEEYQKIMDTNLKGVIFLTRIVSNYMISNKIKGNILNIASSSSIRPVTTAYTLSKWGIKGLTIGFAKTLIKNDIVVNGLAPGPTATPMLIKDNNNNMYIPNNPSERFALPEEIANMAVILTSNLGRMIVGDIIYMTGGAGILTVDDINY